MKAIVSVVVSFGEYEMRNGEKVVYLWYSNNTGKVYVSNESYRPGLNANGYDKDDVYGIANEACRIAGF